MKPGKLLVLLLGLAAVAFAAKFALTGGQPDNGTRTSSQKRQLDNVREKAKDLERLGQEQADDVAKKSAEQ